MANLTQHAMALSAVNNGVYSDDFVAEFLNSSGALSIVYNISLYYSLYATALNYVIQNKDEEINSVIKDRLTSLYHNENDSESFLTVAISLNKFGRYIYYLCCAASDKLQQYFTAIAQTDLRTPPRWNQPQTLRQIQPVFRL